MDKFALSFLTVIWLCLCPIGAQTDQSRRPLTVILNELSVVHKTRISFSPNLTNQIYPPNINVKGDFTEVLGKVLEGTNLAFKRVNERHYYIYWRELPKIVAKQPVRKEEPSAKSLKDTMKLRLAFPNMNSIRLTHTAMPRRLSLPIRPLPTREIPKPRLAIKTNLLYDAMATLNWGIELKLGESSTLDISGNYNSWAYSDNRKMKHWLIQPEFRFWNCTSFNGGFWGIHVHYAQYNWGGIIPVSKYRYEGWLAGGGISYGYHWIIGKRWGLEAEIGAGYTYLKYDKFRCNHCGEKMNSANKHYFGPTRAAINLIFLVK